MVRPIKQACSLCYTIYNTKNIQIYLQIYIGTRVFWNQVQWQLWPFCFLFCANPCTPYSVIAKIANDQRLIWQMIDKCLLAYVLGLCFEKSMFYLSREESLRFWFCPVYFFQYYRHKLIGYRVKITLNK